MQSLESLDLRNNNLSGKIDKMSEECYAQKQNRKFELLLDEKNNTNR